MQQKQVNDGYFLRLEKDEEIISTLTEFATSNKLNASFFQAIGAVTSVEIGFYHLDVKEYKFKKIIKNLEIASLIGNITNFQNQLTIHAHGVFSDENYTTIGGHVTNAIVSATCEVYITYFQTRISRKVNEEIGLKLLDLERNE